MSGRLGGTAYPALRVHRDYELRTQGLSYPLAQHQLQGAVRGVLLSVQDTARENEAQELEAATDDLHSESEVQYNLLVACSSARLLHLVGLHAYRTVRQGRQRLDKLLDKTCYNRGCYHRFSVFCNPPVTCVREVVRTCVRVQHADNERLWEGGERE